jgi:hypothetical protein
MEGCPPTIRGIHRERSPQMGRDALERLAGTRKCTSAQTVEPELFFRDDCSGEEGLRQVIAPSFFHVEGDGKRKEVVQLLRRLLCQFEAIQPILFYLLKELAKSGKLIRHLPTERRFTF